MIERGKGVAIWRQIAEDLQSQILRGDPASGEQLPTEMELAGRYDVNRHTIRRAISALANDGYVTAERGRGTFVSPRPIAYPITARTRFSEIVSAQDQQPGGRLISSSEVSATAEIGEKLAVKEGDGIVRLETLRVAEGLPVTVGTSWFVARLVPNLITDYAELGSISKALSRAGFAEYRRKKSWISSERASEGDARLLQIVTGDPVLVVDSLNVTADGVPLQYSHSRFSGALVQLVVDN